MDPGENPQRSLTYSQIFTRIHQDSPDPSCAWASRSSEREEASENLRDIGREIGDGGDGLVNSGGFHEDVIGIFTGIFTGIYSDFTGI